MQLQHQFLLLNKIVDDTTNETKTLENQLEKTCHTKKELYKEIQLILDKLTKYDVNIMVLTNEHHDKSEELGVNKSPAVTNVKQLINSEKVRRKLQIEVTFLHKLVEKSNMECIKQFTHSKHKLFDKNEVTKETENILYKCVTPSNLTVQPGVKK